MTQQQTLTPPTPKKTNKNKIPDNHSSDDSSEDSPVELQYSESPPRKMDFSEDDQESEATDPMDNTLEELSDTRVDIKIKIPPSESPEETTAYVLQQLLIKLKTYDKKASFAPWQEKNRSPPSSLIPACPQDLP